MRRLLRLLGSLMVVAGALVVAWIVLVWAWQDPFTAWYTHEQQNHLAAVYDRRLAIYSAKPQPKPVAGPVYQRREILHAAQAYERSLHVGDPVGRMRIPRIGLNMIVVQGTDEETLKKGPGHDLRTRLPGEGQLIYVAGHRTTYLAPFSHIDAIRNGDLIIFQLPYGTFTYRAFRHYIVRADDLAVLKDHGHEVLRLQACHPRFFATHRYLVDARLVTFQAPNARAAVAVSAVATR